jgi:HK97 family phage portal protein
LNWKFWKRDTESQSESITPQVDNVLLRALLAGEPIDRDKAMALPAVSGAVDLICSTVASIPVKLYRRVDGGRVEEVVDDKRTFLINYDTGDTLDGFQFKKAIVEDYLLGKGGYAYIEKSGNNFIGLNYVRDVNVSITTNSDPIFKHYKIMVNAQQFEPFEFLKILRNTKNGAYGTGVVEQLSKAIETAYQTLLYQLNLVKSGGNKRGFLKATRRLGQDEIDTIKKAWNNLYGNNSSNTVVLNNGLEFQEASNSSVEMQLNESKQTLKGEINTIFHINEENYDATFKNAILPILKAFECALNRDFLLEEEKGELYYEFDITEITRASIKDRYEAYKTAVETGWITLNEIRARENMNGIDGLDVIPLNLANVMYNTDTHEYFVPNTGQVKPEEAPTTEPENGGEIIES